MREESDQKTTPIDSVLQELRRTLKITRPLTVLDVESKFPLVKELIMQNCHPAEVVNSE